MMHRLKSILLVLLLSIGMTSLNATEIPEEYIQEIKKDFGDKVALNYANYAQYFSSIVKPGKEKYISKKLLSVFNNPGDSDVFDLFLLKLNKKLAKGKHIDQVKVSQLQNYLEPIGKKLDSSIEKYERRIAEQEKKIIQLREKLKILESQTKEVIRQRKEVVKVVKEIKEIRRQRKEVEEEIKKVRQLIIEWGGAVKLLKEKIDG